MPKLAESDEQQLPPRAPDGCDGAAIALPLSTTLGAVQPARATTTKKPAPPSWLSEGVRRVGRAVKRSMSDELYLKLSHLRHVGRVPNLRDPKTFNEHILQRCLNPEPLWSTLADKLAVRDFVKQRIGEAHLVPLIAVPEVFTEEVFNSLPDAFVMKANHGCGQVEIVRNKRQTSFEHLKRLAQTWLATDFSLVSRERHYRSIKPALYFEQLLLDRSGHIPSDLKLNMFGRDATGQPIIYAGIVSDRFGSPHGDVFDVHWNQVELTVGHYQRSKTPPPPPSNWEEIVRLATRLADGLGYVRVDIYVPDGKVYFGELTFTPGAGVFPFHPDRYDYEWGKLFRNMSKSSR